jgi:hypothetical protein
MERHPYFDLWLHDTPELAEHLGVEILERTTIHDWPLSCVQLLRLADGRRIIYKSQLRAISVEPDFFTAVNRDQSGVSRRSRSLLPRAETLRPLVNSVGMLFEYIEAPRLEDLQLNEAEILEHGDRLLSELHQFPAEMPVIIDISSIEKWLEYAEDTFSMMYTLIKNGKYRLTEPAMIQELTAWSNSKAIRDAFQAPPVLNHRDLGWDNVFVTPQGYKVIDWQRPARGPAELDRVNYLDRMGVDPLKYAQRSMVELNWFIHLRWFTECKLHWFPEGDYDPQVAELTNLILQPGQ